MVFGRFRRHSLVEVYHPLVGMVHEIDLHRRDAPFRISLEDGVEVVVNRQPGYPEHDFYADAVAVADQLPDVQVRVSMEGIRRGHRPSFIQEDVFDTELRGEIGIILIRGQVATGLEVHIGTVGRGAVPPFPGELAGVDPAGIIQDAPAGKLGGEGLFDDALGVRHRHPAPREGAAGGRLGDIRGLLDDFLAPVSARLPAERRLRVGGNHRRPVRGVEQVRIVVQIAFTQEELRIVRPGQEQRRGRHLAVRCGPVRERSAAVGLLAGGIERPGRLVVRRKAIGRNQEEMVVKNLHIPLPIHYEPVGNGIVHDAEKQRNTLSQTDFRLVVLVNDRRELERDDRLELVVHEPRLPNLHAAVGNGFRSGYEADVADLVHGFPLLDNRVGHTAGTRFQVHGEFPVRGE